MHWIFNTQPWRRSQCISQAHTLTLGREKFTGSCNGESLWQLLHFHLFLPLPLPLPHRVSHSPNMTRSHVDKVSLTVAAATYRSHASPTPWCPSPRLYLHLISLAANDSMQAFPCTELCIRAPGDEDWQQVASRETECRCTDAPTHTHIRDKHTPSRLSQLTCRLCVHGSVTGRIVLAQWQTGPRPLGATGFLSLAPPVSGSLSLSASGFVVFPPRQKV